MSATIDADRLPGRSIEELEEALAARDSFIASLGHELRNSVAPLVMLADLFATQSSRVRPELMTKNLNRLISTIERIAEVGQLRDGRFTLALERLDLGATVAQTVQKMDREALAGGVDLRLTIADDVAVVGDRARVKQIVAGLLSNAIKFSGGGIVEVIVQATDRTAELVVRDYGPGIPEADRKHLFERFDRADRIDRPRGGGFGVGLWIAKTLCTAMGGSIVVEHVIGPGARFCVSLPRD